MSHCKAKVLVTGGGGFLGRYLCRALQAESYDVLSFSRSYYPHLEAAGVPQVQGDLLDLASLERALTGCHAIIHTAAKAGIWGSFASFYRSNVLGTANVIAAARKQGVRKLVYTSSPSVVFAGKDIHGADESIPYAQSFKCFYPQSKKIAEQSILGANGQNGLATVALRPHLIWGPDDPHFLPRLIARAQAGKLRRIGSLENKVDIIYVENAASAHVKALQRLNLGAPHAGKAYFIGQERPVKLWDFIDQLLRARQLAPLQKTIPFPLAYALGSGLEGLYKVAGIYEKEPPMTRFLALQLAKSHYFSHRNAQKDFAYTPKVSIEQGLARLSTAEA